MISNQARDGFDRLLTRALKASLTVSEEDAFEIAAVDHLDGLDASTIVVLTISSYLFRTIVMLHFSSDEATREHVARINKMAVEEMTEQSFHDAIAECGNICCGIFNRDLGAIFPHIGMSTPNIIGSKCVAYLDMLNGGHIQHFAIDIAQQPLFHVSLCVCDYADLDFAVDANEESADTGELELF
jgi:CheY-specific phosphatase CheX